MDENYQNFSTVTEFVNHPFLFHGNETNEYCCKNIKEDQKSKSSKVNKLQCMGPFQKERVSTWFRRNIYQVYCINKALHDNNQLYVFDFLARDCKIDIKKEHCKEITKQCVNPYTIICILHSSGKKSLYLKGVQQMQNMKTICLRRYYFKPKFLLLHVTKKQVRKKWC